LYSFSFFPLAFFVSVEFLQKNKKSEGSDGFSAVPANDNDLGYYSLGRFFFFFFFLLPLP